MAVQLKVQETRPTVLKIPNDGQAKFQVTDLVKVVSGGGGFSTAHVTIINSNHEGFTVACPSVFDGEEGGEEFHVIVGTVGMLGHDQAEQTAVLYKGSMIIFDPDGNHMVTAVSGSAEIMDGGYTAFVTGDATVTF